MNIPGMFLTTWNVTKSLIKHPFHSQLSYFLDSLLCFYIVPRIKIVLKVIISCEQN